MRLPPPGTRVGVAVSGGADSTALLLLLLDVWDRGLLCAIHVNHGLRGADSDGDEQFCRDLAATAGIPIHVHRTGGAAGESGKNLEECAREERLSYFRQLIDDGVVDAIMTAHTRDDQAETVLFRLLRGASLAGLAGIHTESPLGRGRLLRPVLDRTRTELRAELEKRDQTWREDTTNASPEFRRNRIRLELLPQLERDWNPELSHTLAQTAELAWDEEQFWKSYTAHEAEQVFLPQKGNTWTVDASKLISRPVAVARRLVRWALERVRGDLRQIDFPHVEAVLALARQEEGHGRIILPGADIMRSFEWLRFAAHDPSNAEDKLAARNREEQVSVPGEAVAADGSVIRLEAVDDTVEASGVLFFGPEGLPETVTLRSWKPGDQYRPSGYGEPKKLKSLFQDCRVPLWDRGTWPIITLGKQIIWARQFGPAHEFSRGAQATVGLRITRIG